MKENGQRHKMTKSVFLLLFNKIKKYINLIKLNNLILLNSNSKINKIIFKFLSLNFHENINIAKWI